MLRILIRASVWSWVQGGTRWGWSAAIKSWTCFGINCDIFVCSYMGLLIRESVACLRFAAWDEMPLYVLFHHGWPVWTKSRRRDAGVAASVTSERVVMNWARWSVTKAVSFSLS